MSALTGRAVMQKQTRYESKRHTALAHDMPCMATFPHNCQQHNGCDPSHANWLLWGKGVGLKVGDWAWASLCRAAHDIIDRRTPSDMDEETLQQEWMRAFISTQDHLWRERKLRVA